MRRCESAGIRYGEEDVRTGVEERGLGLILPSSMMLAGVTGLVGESSPPATVARLPRERLVLGGKGFTLCFVGLVLSSGIS